MPKAAESVTGARGGRALERVGELLDPTVENADARHGRRVRDRVSDTHDAAREARFAFRSPTAKHRNRSSRKRCALTDLWRHAIERIGQTDRPRLSDVSADVDRNVPLGQYRRMATRPTPAGSARSRRRGLGALAPRRSEVRAFMREHARRHPQFWRAVAADARCARAQLGQPITRGSRAELIRAAASLCATHDGFAALVAYRAKARLQGLGVPGLPRIAHRLAITLGNVAIGDPVSIEPGIYLPHGNVVIDGFVRVGAGTAVRPFVTIGLIEADPQGPTIGRKVLIGTGAKILGPGRDRERRARRREFPGPLRRARARDCRWHAVPNCSDEHGGRGPGNKRWTRATPGAKQRRPKGKDACTTR